MNDQAALALRYRELGFFDLQDSAAGLLAEAGQFLTRHKAAPRSVETRKGSRGWQAIIELEWADFVRIFDGMNVDELSYVAGEDGAATVVARVELRSASVSAQRPWSGGGRVVDGGVWIGGTTAPAAPEARSTVVIRPR